MFPSNMGSVVAILSDAFGDSWRFASANIVLYAYRLAIAADITRISEHDLAQVITQLQFENAIVDLKGDHIDFDKYFYVVDPSQYCHEDDNHKLKGVARSVRDQVKHDESNQDGHLIQLRHIVAAIKHNREELEHISGILSTNADDQNVVICQELVYSRPLRDTLVALGHWTTAAALKAFGDAHMAFDMPGLTVRQRTLRLSQLKRLLNDTLLVDARMHSVEGICSGLHVAGLPRDLVFAILGNIDCREQLLKNQPWVADVVVDRFWSTDDLEYEFGVLVGRVGYKPTWEVAAGALHASDELMSMMRNPASGISLPMSRRKKYSWNKATTNRKNQWNTPLTTEQEEAYLADITRRAKMVIKHKDTIRTYHQHQQGSIIV
ncbi:hypothetical protein CYMTET_10574 [Cymbomonas tetramitiformis]|uniref:Uncharacterized protein n=1 Tax=Cymbomonas tetramitiformis TaxID=36881 RepID=A0AAE0LDV7_9CHLO|nr:hypothetical protein CYMTET_10574 [Cymbomonas tetramitiformis]